jgi:hypothetical protein
MLFAAARHLHGSSGTGAALASDQHCSSRQATASSFTCRSEFQLMIAFFDAFGFHKYSSSVQIV